MWLGAGMLLVSGAVMGVGRSGRAAAALISFYLPQLLLLVWVEASLAQWGLSPGPWLAACLGLLLTHRLTTYVFPLPPGRLDRVWFPLIHTLQTAVLLGLVGWPLSRLLPASAATDLAVIAALLLGSGVALWRTHTALRTEAITVRLPGLREPVRVAQISDLHIGPYTPPARLQKIADAVVGLRPDLIALTGDLLTLRSEQDLSGLDDFFARLPRPAGGIWVCMGNHDVAAAGALAVLCERQGIGLLVDACAAVGELSVIGLDWRGSVDGYAPALSGLCSDRPTLLLCHDPAPFALLDGWRGLMLSGHLHGGQIRIGGRSLPGLLGLRDEGLHRVGDRALYVHRGTGTYGFPVRLGVPPEVALLKLTPGG